MDMAKFQASYIAAKGALMLLLTLVSVLATILVGYLGSRVAAGVARDLRWNLFAKVESFSLAEFDRFSTASLITRSTNDVSQMQMVTQIGLRMMFYAPIVGIGGIVRATSKASDMWWIIAVAVATLLGLVGAVFLVSLPKFTGIQKLTDRLNLVVRENLSGMMVIRAFAREEYERQRFEEANGDLSRTMLFVQRVMTIMMPLMMVIMNLFSILIIWVGAHEVARSSIRIGDMMAFMQYSMQIFFSFLALSMMFIMLPRATVSADRIADVLETESAIKDPENPLSPPPDAKGVVEFRNVAFRYPGADEEVLRDISFTAAPGSTTAIVGTTGSGKSTLVALVPRLYDVTDGAILVDGIDVRRMSQRELRARIGFVPQKTSLFSGTIGSNLLYADEKAAPEDIKEALATSQASEFVDGMPEGMLAPISQGGSNVSGGQKQRLTIARALVRKAPICIFDDSFSALDFRTDSRLRSALREKAGYSTVFLVAQRIATIKDADQIIVLDQGRMVGKGRQRELMETCDVYRNIALSQLKREELA